MDDTHYSSVTYTLTDRFLSGSFLRAYGIIKRLGGLFLHVYF